MTVSPGRAVPTVLKYFPSSSGYMGNVLAINNSTAASSDLVGGNLLPQSLHCHTLNPLYHSHCLTVVLSDTEVVLVISDSSVRVSDAHMCLCPTDPHSPLAH